VRELIRKDQDRERVRGLLLKGAASPATTPADKAYFKKLRRSAERRELPAAVEIEASHSPGRGEPRH